MSDREAVDRLEIATLAVSAPAYQRARTAARSLP